MTELSTNSGLIVLTFNAYFNCFIASKNPIVPWSCKILCKFYTNSKIKGKASIATKRSLIQATAATIFIWQQVMKTEHEQKPEKIKNKKN